MRPSISVASAGASVTGHLNRGIDGVFETDRYLSAFGAKRTCRGRRERVDPTRMTQSRQRLLRNPAVR
jgi:hypothetical protein